MANEGFGTLSTIINAAAMGDTYDEVAASSAIVSTGRADAAYVYAKAVLGTATSVVVEVSVSPDDGTNWFVVEERTLSAAAGLKAAIPLLLASDFETKVRVRAKANADSTTGTITAQYQIQSLKFPVAA